MTDDQRLSAIKHWASNGYSMYDPSLCNAAAYFGHINSLRYLHETYDCPLTNTCSYAIGGVGKKVDCFQYAHEHGELLEFPLIEHAAEHGNVVCMQYVHEHGCPWGPNVCDISASNGNVDCLRYAHQHGAPWTTDTTNLAAIFATNYSYHESDYACLLYAFDHGLEPTSYKLMDTWNEMITRRNSGKRLVDWNVD